MTVQELTKALSPMGYTVEETDDVVRIIVDPSDFIRGAPKLQKDLKAVGWRRSFSYRASRPLTTYEAQQLAQWLNELKYLREKIEQITIMPEPRWIPCSERLPDDLAEVNVTWVNHEPEPYYESIKSKPFTASAVYYEGNWYWYSSVCADVLAEYGRNDVDKVDDTIEITAWKPLPEPYRGGDSD